MSLVAPSTCAWMRNIVAFVTIPAWESCDATSSPEAPFSITIVADCPAGIPTASGAYRVDQAK